jgi:tetratricopeptide (TPR) repeat protein
LPQTVKKRAEGADKQVLGEMCVFAKKGGPVITLVLLAVLGFPPQQDSAKAESKQPVAPEQVLAWQLEGLTQEEIQEEVKAHGLSECADAPLLNALAAARADAQTVEVVRHSKAPCKLLKLDLRLPKPTDYLYEMAGAMLWNDGQHAMQTIETEASKQPQNPDVRLIYAHVLSMSGDLILAYEEATAAERLNPRWPYTHAQRSTICYRAGLTACAIHEALRFREMREADASAYIILGNARELQGHDDEALEAYTQARKLHAGYAELYAGLGRVYGRAGAFDQALASYDEAIRLDKWDAKNYCELAQLYEAEGHAGKAIGELKDAKELEPRNPQIAMALGNAYLEAKQYAEAAQEYRELLEADPEMDGVRPQLARALRGLGREAEAEALFAEPALETPSGKPH